MLPAVSASAPPVVQLARDLMRLDTSNPGATELAAAELVCATIADTGSTIEVVESAPGRRSVIARHRGADPTLPAVVIHGHLDVVPAREQEWTHPPFGGEIADGCLWGRGALDMKASVAMMRAAQLELAAGHTPRRDVIFAYFADEEMGGTLGSQWIVEHRPELFAGAAWAIGEVGGFRVTRSDGRRAYMLQVAEKGMVWLRISIPGSAGHAAYPVVSNPIERAAALVARLATLNPVAAPAGAPAHRMPGFDELVLLGSQTTCRVTAIAAGEKLNVVPDVATLHIDLRPVPGTADEAVAAVVELLDPDMRHEVLVRSDGIAAPPAGEIDALCRGAVAAVDPEAAVLPFTLAAGTDAQRLAALGIVGYGFMPLALPDDFDFLGGFHSLDERVPVDALVTGYEIFRHLVHAL